MSAEIVGAFGGLFVIDGLLPGAQVADAYWIVSSRLRDMIIINKKYLVCNSRS